jgi:hypothetical protein
MRPRIRPSAAERRCSGLAVEAGVPFVPVVTAGAGQSLLVLSDGRRLARALRLDTGRCG